MIAQRQIFGGLGNRMFQMAYLYAQARKGLIPDWYVQDPQYFEGYEEELKTLFGQDLRPNHLVSLHIRRGDYVNNGFYIDLTQTDYYQKAIKEFPNDSFLVFCADRQPRSDDATDQDWCRDFLLNTLKLDPARWLIYDGADEIQDFNAMASCKAHIIANSSFSWWAAFVGGSHTVAPSKWFSDGKKRIGLLKEWKII